MKASILALTSGALLAAVALAPGAEYFADTVLSYTTGPGSSGDGFNSTLVNAAVALGKPGGTAGSATFNPFNPHYQPAEVVQVRAGGELTLRLSNYVIVTPGLRELGIWENIFLFPSSSVSGSFGADSAVVSVSEDGVNWFSLNGGLPITFDLPGNYYANATGATAAPPANPVLADFGQPFTGTLASFTGQNFSGVLSTLGGTAGGTWLDLDSSGLAQVGYVRFDGVPSGQTLEINGVGINGALAGAAVPEPSSTALFVATLVGAVVVTRRRPMATAPSSL